MTYHFRAKNISDICTWMGVTEKMKGHQNSIKMCRDLFWLEVKYHVVTLADAGKC